jgi:hypothetical protein
VVEDVDATPKVVEDDPEEVAAAKTVENGTEEKSEEVKENGAAVEDEDSTNGESTGKYLHGICVCFAYIYINIYLIYF